MLRSTVDELEEFVRLGRLWDADDVQRIVGVLRGDARETKDANADALARFLDAVRLRGRVGPIDPRTADDIEGVVWPRLWKVMEAVRDDLPATEVRTRIEVMNRRLSRVFAREQPR